MSSRNPVAWWKWTRIAAGGASLLVLAIVIAAPLVWQAGRTATLFSVPLAELAIVILLPFGLAFFVRRAWLLQDDLDRNFSVWEDK
jgi:hypothetical protein